jgi:hypothetical protein
LQEQCFELLSWFEVPCGTVVLCLAPAAAVAICSTPHLGFSQSQADGFTPACHLLLMVVLHSLAQKNRLLQTRLSFAQTWASQLPIGPLHWTPRVIPAAKPCNVALGWQGLGQIILNPDF